MPDLEHFSDGWLVLEATFTSIFTCEYLIRMSVCDISGSSLWTFIRAPMNLVDLLSIMPFYIWLAFESFNIAKAFGILRAIRLVRLARVFRYSSGLQLVTVALRNSSQALWVLVFFLCIGLILF